MTVTSEEGCPVTSRVNLCVAIWNGKPAKEKAVPSNVSFCVSRRFDAAQYVRLSFFQAKLYRTEKPCVGAYTFTEIAAPAAAGPYCVCFCLCESRHSRNFTMLSEILQMEVEPGM